MMIYNGRVTPPDNWPPLIRYPRYYPDRRLSILWFFAFAILALLLSVIALIIVFAVEHSWFYDNYNGTITRYGLWRVCFFGNNSCDSWFSTNGIYSRYVDDRLNVSRAGINAWQALEIIFLFLTTATLAISIASIVCYRIRHSLHYYLAILAIFCVWPAVSIGVSALFVFGFAVFNVAPPPRELDWCFYVNLAAVILAVIAAILLSIYDALLKKPNKTVEDDTVIETFADLNGYPAALSPSTFVIVRRNKKKRNKPYDYPQVLHPNNYFPTTTTVNGRIVNGGANTNYIPTTNHQILSPYTSVVTTHETTNTTLQPLQQQLQPQQQQQQQQQQRTPQQPLPPYRSFEYNQSNLVTSPSTITTVPRSPIPMQTQPFRTPVSTYPYPSRASPTHWHRSGTNTMNQSIGYASEPTHNHTPRDFYYPNRSNLIERTFEQKQEPRVLHYYTGYDYFAAIDPSDATLTRHHPPITGPGTAIRYGVNRPYHHQNDYIKSTM